MANRTYVVLKRDVAEYIGAPVGGRGPYIAGVALNSAIDFLNSRTLPLIFTIADITYTLGAKTYSLPTRFNVHIASVLLNSAGTRVEKWVPYLTQRDFFLAGFETTDETGLADFITVEPYNSLVRLNKAPTASEVGRKLRVGYYMKLNKLTGDSDKLGGGSIEIDDSLEEVVVQEAIWRAKRMARMDYGNDKAIANEAFRTMLSKPVSVDIVGHGMTGV